MEIVQASSPIKTWTPVEGMSFSFYYDRQEVANTCGATITKAVAQVLLFLELTALQVAGVITDSTSNTVNYVSETVEAGKTDVKVYLAAVRHFLGFQANHYILTPINQSVAKTKEVYAVAYNNSVAYLYSSQPLL